MGTPMSDRQRQQRAAMIVGGAAVGGLAIIGLAIALSSGGDDGTNAIDVLRSSTTSSSTTSSSSTSTSTSTTTTLVTLPPTVPSTAPPTIITVPTLPPPPPTTAGPTTSPPTTAPPTTGATTSTTNPPTPAEQLALSLDVVLNDGQPDAPQRVTVQTLSSSKALDVTWKLNPLPPDQQGVQARADALALMEAIQSADPPGNDKFRLKATIQKPGPDQVVFLTIDRSEFDGFDFSSFDPADQDVFKLPFVTSSKINENYVADPYPPTTTTTTDEPTTSTTDETTTTTT
jgi:hypothetical protein